MLDLSYISAITLTFNSFTVQKEREKKPWIDKGLTKKIYCSDSGELNDRRRTRPKKARKGREGADATDHH